VGRMKESSNTNFSKAQNWNKKKISSQWDLHTGPDSGKIPWGCHYQWVNMEPQSFHHHGHHPVEHLEVGTEKPYE
jgi:hypothetical protein